MGRKSRLKRERRETKYDEAGLFLSSLSDFRKQFDPDELRAAVKRRGEAFEPSLDSLVKLLSQVHPFSLLTKLTAYCLTSVEFDDGSTERMERTGLQQGHVELLQALILQFPPETFPSEPAPADQVTKVIETVVDLSAMFKAKRLVRDHGDSVIEHGIAKVQEHVRMHTEIVRQWGYHSRVERIVEALVEPLAALSKAALGFSFGDVIRVFSALSERTGDLVSDHFERLRPVAMAKTPEAMIRAYYRANAALKDIPEDFIDLMRTRGALSREGVLYHLLPHADHLLTGKMMFTADEIAVGTQIDSSVVAAVLSMHSLKLGELAGANRVHLFLDNQIWTKPIISTGRHHFCAVPQVFYAFPFQTLDRLATASVDLKRALDQRRADFLEAEVESIFREAFPDAAVYPGLQWKTVAGDAEYEQDLVAKLDSILILVESKSGRVAPEALRGAPKSLRETIDALLIEPSRQSLRFETAVMGAKQGDVAYAHLARQLPFDVTSVQRIVRLTVTLDDFGSIQSSLNALRQAEYVPKDLAVAPAMTVADLEIVFDMLDGPVQKLHYLMRRTALEDSMEFFGDEMDLLGLYLQRGLSLGGLETKGDMMILSGMSKPVDDYYIALDLGSTPTKPALRLHPRWAAALLRLSTARPPRWLEAATMLLDMAPEEQAQFVKKMDKTIDRVRRDREKAAHQNALVFIPNNGRQVAIVGVAFYDTQFHKRHDMMGDVAAVALKHEGIKWCLVMAFAVDGRTFPYRSLGVFFSDDSR